MCRRRGIQQNTNPMKENTENILLEVVIYEGGFESEHLAFLFKLFNMSYSLQLWCSLLQYVFRQIYPPL